MTTTDLPPAFVAALHSLKETERRPGLIYREIPPPRQLSKHSVAMSIETVAQQGDQPLATGTLVILYDPLQADIWENDFRVIGHLRAQIDAEMSVDPLLNEVIWVGLLEQLDRNTTGFTQALGTVTKELSQSFGGLTLRASVLNIELRCSWSAQSNLGAHLYAWSDYVMQTAGLPNEDPFGLYVASTSTQNGFSESDDKEVESTTLNGVTAKLYPLKQRDVQSER